MTVFIMSDMEGLSGIDRWDQCYHPDDNAECCRYGCEQLTGDIRLCRKTSCARQ